MSFFETEFPKTIGYKAMGGPALHTTINPGFSGFEQRNKNWSISRGQWTISLQTPGDSTDVNPQVFIDQLTAFFLNVGARADAFRLKDHKDFTNGTIAQPIGVGDGVTGNFILVKNYTTGNRNYQRTISKPVTSLVTDYLGQALLDTVNVKVNTTTQPAAAGYVGSPTAKYTLDETTGMVSFGSSTVMTITGISSLNGQWQIFYTLVSGAAPLKNQQVFVHNATVNFPSDTLVITSVGAGYFTINKSSSAGFSASTGTAYTGWGDLAITAVSMSGSNATYSFTQTSGIAPASGQRVIVRGMGHAGNNCTAYIVSTGVGTFTVINGTGSTQTESGVAILDWVPASGAGTIFATFQYHMPVRFDTDDLAIQLEPSDVEGGKPIISWNSITLQEVRIIPGQSQG